MPQWEGVNGEPPAPVQVSQAAVLFDVAYAAALTHNAHVLVITRATIASFGSSLGLFIATAIPAIWQWWAISLFLCRYDSGDLVNELILVVYMVLVLGQSFTIRNCASCLLSKDTEDSCSFLADRETQDSLEGLQCTALGPTLWVSMQQSEHADWPGLPYQCWLYALLSVLPRVILFLNHMRAICEIQRRGRRHALLQSLDLACVLPMW